MKGSKMNRRLVIDNDSSEDSSDEKTGATSGSKNRCGKRTSFAIEHNSLTKSKKLFKTKIRIPKSSATDSGKDKIDNHSSAKQIIHAKKKQGKKSAQAKAVTTPSPSGPTIPSAKKLSIFELKPRLKVGEEVYSAWWPNAVAKKENNGPIWYPGRIKSVEEGKNYHARYGPVRYYSIEFDDGDEIDHVDDAFVWIKSDYILSMGKRNSKKEWIGVKNVTDSRSRDEWASIVGWWVATLDGQVHTFSFLSEALRAYDASVARRKGAKTKASDLNLPEEWELSP